MALGSDGRASAGPVLSGLCRSSASTGGHWTWIRTMASAYIDTAGAPRTNRIRTHRR